MKKFRKYLIIIPLIAWALIFVLGPGKGKSKAEIKEANEKGRIENLLNSLKAKR